MKYVFLKQTYPKGKSDANYIALKASIKNLVNAASADLPFDDVIAHLKSNPPTGWTETEFTEGLIKQVAQDLNLPHA